FSSALPRPPRAGARARARAREWLGGDAGPDPARPRIRTAPADRITYADRAGAQLSPAPALALARHPWAATFRNRQTRRVTHDAQVHASPPPRRARAPRPVRRPAARAGGRARVRRVP